MKAPAEMRGAISDRVMGRPMVDLVRRGGRTPGTCPGCSPAIVPAIDDRTGWFSVEPAGRECSACHYGAVASTSASAGTLLRHVRTGRARSRADLVALTGASRNTVSARVDQLIAANLLEEGGRGWSTGGRPPTLLQF